MSTEQSMRDESPEVTEKQLVDNMFRYRQFLIGALEVAKVNILAEVRGAEKDHMVMIDNARSAVNAWINLYEHAVETLASFRENQGKEDNETNN